MHGKLEEYISLSLCHMQRTKAVLFLFAGRTKTANAETIQQSISCCNELDAKLKLVYIMRSKKDELGDELPEKDETVRTLQLIYVAPWRKSRY